MWFNLNTRGWTEELCEDSHLSREIRRFLFANTHMYLFVSPGISNSLGAVESGRMCFHNNRKKTHKLEAQIMFPMKVKPV